MKKIIIAVLAVLLTLSLTACGSQSRQRGNKIDVTSSASQQHK